MAGRKYDGIVHFVSESLVDEIGDSRVVVWWLNCSKGKWWEGQLVGRSISILKQACMEESFCVQSVNKFTVHIIPKELYYVY